MSTTTRQVNLKLTYEHEELVRLFVRRLREGGPEYERRVRVFLSEALEPKYMHVDELDRRFGALERRLHALEGVLDEHAPPDWSTVRARNPENV